MGQSLGETIFGAIDSKRFHSVEARQEKNKGCSLSGLPSAYVGFRRVVVRSQEFTASVIRILFFGPLDSSQEMHSSACCVITIEAEAYRPNRYTCVELCRELCFSIIFSKCLMD